MSSMPPNAPGGMPPYPPYDPKTQWRVYREQQKAAWRTQRDAMRAQRHAWRSGYYGTPRVPSIVGPLILIAIGIIWLLIYTQRLPAQQFWAWYGHWWPLVLIAAGLAMLGEWALDMRRPVPVHRRGSFAGILILVVILGLCAAGWTHMGWIDGPWNGNNGGFFNMFGMPEHDADQPAITQPIPANAEVDIQVPLGDVSVTAGDGPDLEVQAHEVAFAGSDSDAQRIFEAEKATVNASGDTVVVKAPSSDHGRVNLAVTVPKTARVNIHSGWNDVTASGLGAGINLTARGDVHLNAITGPIELHFINGRHNDISIHQADGDIRLDGDCDDLTLSEIKGSITQDGQIEGDVHIENVSGSLHLHTSVTDLEIAALPGDMTLDSDDLRVNEATGAVHVTTHAKDVDLNQIYGSSTVEDRDGSISVEPAGAYSIDARNGKGDVEITLPPNAAGTVSGHTHNGDIMNDFGLSVSGEQDKTVTGKIGSGGPQIVLSADNGDLHIKKGPAFPSTPPAPAVEDGTVTSAPHSAHAPHLKALKPLPPQPVTQ